MKWHRSEATHSWLSPEGRWGVGVGGPEMGNGMEKRKRKRKEEEGGRCLDQILLWPVWPDGD